MAFEFSSGNVFADLGLPQPEERLEKAKLAARINSIIKQRRLTQVQAAEILRVDQPKISLLKRGRLSGFSLERLINFLRALDQEVEIVVAPKSPGRASAPCDANPLTGEKVRETTKRIAGPVYASSADLKADQSICVGTLFFFAMDDQVTPRPDPERFPAWQTFNYVPQVVAAQEELRALFGR